MEDRSHAVTPLAGTGWLLAGPVAALFTPEVDPRPTELATLVSDATSGWKLATRLLDAADTGTLADWPAFAIAASVADGLVVVASGVDAFVGPDPEPRPAAGRITVLTVSPLVSVRLGDGAWDPCHPAGELVEGTARAGGMALVSRDSAAALATGSGKYRRVFPPAAHLPPSGALPEVTPAEPAAPETPAASPETPAPAPETPAAPGDSTPTLPPVAPALAAPDPSPPAPSGEPGPPSVLVRLAAAPGPVTVTGVDCARGHFNDPDARFCRVCGLGMHQGSRVETTGHRPAIGVLVWDHGGSDQVESDLVIGREPQIDPRVTSGEAAGLTPAGDVSRLSRVHAEIRIDDWDARVVDRHSSNGTFVWVPEQQGWRRLAPGESVTLEAGMRIAFGERVAVYETGSPSF